MKCLYCKTEPNNATTDKTLHVCSCYKLHADYTYGMKLIQHDNAPKIEYTLGDKVMCSGYLKKTHNNYIYSSFDGDTGSLKLMDTCYRNWDDRLKNENQIEDYDDQNRYELVEKEFEGVYVGTTTVNLNLVCEYVSDCYGGEGWHTYTNTPFKCARIYYADNKSRLVPFDKLEK